MRCPPEEHLIIGNDAYGKRNVHTEIDDALFDTLTLYMTRKLDELAILSEDVELFDKTFDIETTGIAPVIGNFICLQEGTHYYQGKILVVTPIAGNQYTITVGTPLDYAFTTAGGCALTSPELAVDGSVVPITFYISPENLDAAVSWHVTNIRLHITDNSAMDDSLFGGIPALTNGLVIRTNNSHVKNNLTLRNNGNMFEHGELKYSDKAPSGFYGLSFTKYFNGLENHGVVITLNAGTGDRFEALVQDNLSGLTSLRIVVEGHFDQHED